jgi:hypothetical protein
MDVLILFIVLAVTLFIGVPLAWSIGLTALS